MYKWKSSVELQPISLLKFSKIEAIKVTQVTSGVQELSYTPCFMVQFHLKLQTCKNYKNK